MEGVDVNAFCSPIPGRESISEENTSLGNEKDIENKQENASVCQFYLKGKCRFGGQCRNLHEGEQCRNLHEGKLSTNKSRQRKSGGEREEEDGRFEKKKSSMRTAEDVINRIKWDETLPEENFTVGYLDRFLGVLEESFSTFSWEELAGADLEVLAVPQHRIQYFKYRQEKVWEKATRLDLVFGSTGSHLTIQEVMENVDRKVQEEENIRTLQTEI